jgi:hypothetical protein
VNGNTKKPKELDDGEEAVRARLQTILGVDVEQLDFGGGASIADLKIAAYPDRDHAPVEVTSDGDTRLMAGLNYKGDRNWPATTLNSSWKLVCIGDVPAWKKVQAESETLVKVLEGAGIDDFHPGIAKSLYFRGMIDEADRAVWEALNRLHELRIGSGRTTYTSNGEPPTIEIVLGTGGPWDMTADAVAAWATAFVNDPSRSDNVRKLDRGGAESHLAVHVSYESAGFNVVRGVNDEYRMGILPADDPDLPHTITDLWIAYWFGATDVLHWQRARGWTRHPGTQTR